MHTLIRPGGDTPTAFSGNGLFVTSDGGATWTGLNEKTAKGLPPKPWGRVAVIATGAQIGSSRGASTSVCCTAGSRSQETTH
jgi:hypothetical protein